MPFLIKLAGLIIVGNNNVKIKGQSEETLVIFILSFYSMLILFGIALAFICLI